MKKQIFVIGGINIDIKGVADSGKSAGDSYKGKIIFTPGGVARNIAENMARLGMKVYLFGTTGDDYFGNYIIRESKRSGVNTEFINKCASVETAKYLSVSSEANKIFYAVNDMSESSGKTNLKYIRSVKTILENSSMIVIDANLKEDVIEEIIELSDRKQIPVFADAVSSEKTIVFKNLKRKIDYLSVNENEFKSIFGKNNLSEVFKNKKQKELFQNFGHILLKKGSSGVSLIETANRTVTKCKALKTKIAEPNGAGDSFNAGFIFGLMNGYSKHEAIRMGTCASYLTLRTIKSVSEDIYLKKITELFHIKSRSNEF